MKPCANCKHVVDHPYSFSQWFCTKTCETDYNERAQMVGGFHVLVRDEEIQKLRAEVTALRRQLRLRDDMLRWWVTA